MKETYLCAILKPVYEAGLLTLNIIAVVSQFFLSTFLHYHLDILDTAFEMGIKIACYSWESNFVLFIRMLVDDPDGMS